MRVRRVTSHATVLAVVGVVVAMVACSLAVGSATWSGTPGASGGDASTPAATLTVTIAPSSPAIDSGQNVTLTATASPLPASGYQWWEGTYPSCGSTSGNRPIPGATGSSYTTPPLTSSEYFCVNATGGSPPANASSAATLVTVNPAVADVAVTPASPTVDANVAVTLTENATGGSGALTYTWYSGTSGSCNPFDPVAGATASAYTVPGTSTVGSTSYCVVVNDHSSTAWAGNRSASDTVTVVSAVAAPAPTPSGDAGDSGQSFTLTAAPSGGTGTYTLQWLGGSSSACSGDSTKLGNARTQVVTPTASTDEFCYTVKDSSVNAPVVDSPTTAVTISPTLTAGAITPSTAAFDLGTTLPETVNLTANPSGGTLTGPTGSFPNYLYQWRNGTYATCSVDANIAGATHSWLDLSTASVRSSLYFCYSVTDANGTVAYSSPLLVTVNPALVAGAPSPQSSELDAGDAETLSAPQPTGGTQPFTYQWFEGTGCTLSGTTWTLSGSLIPGATGSTVSVAPTATASYFYRVTDSSDGTYALGERSECSPAATVTVNPALTPAAPSVSPTGALDLGETVTLTRSNVPGTEGTPVVTYAWLSGASATCSADQTVSGQTGTTYTPPAPPLGTTYYCYVVSDGSASPPLIYSSTIAVVVNDPPVAGAVTIASGQVPYVDAGPSGGASAESVTLVANPSLGTGTYAYQWYEGTAANCTADIGSAGKISGATGATYVASGLSSSTAFCYTVTDQASPARTQQPANAFLVTVEPTLTAGKPTASVSSLDLGETVTLTAAASGGYFPSTYTALYQWFTSTAASCSSGTLALVAGATTSPATVAPTVSGTAYYCYRVTDDSNGNPVQQSATSATAVSAHVYLALAAGTAPGCADYGSAAWTGTPTSCAAAKPGDHITLTATPSGGNASDYAYRWYNGTSSVCGTDAVMSGQTGASLEVIVPPTAGSYYCYSINDGSLATPIESPTYFLDPPSGSAPQVVVLAAEVALAAARP
jgi:large repetitive protein